MDEFNILLTQLGTMFIYVVVGWLLCRMGLVTRKTSPAFSNLLLYVIIPCVIVQSFLQEASPEKTLELGLSTMLSALAIGLAALISHLIFKKQPILDFGCTFSNSGFMGIPLITAVLGEDAVFYVSGFLAIFNALQWTYGQMLLGSPKSEIRPLSVLRSPMIVAVFIGLILYFLPIELPSLLTGAIGAIAACNAPVAMILLGVFLGNISLKQMFLDKVAWFASGVRLLLIPALTGLMFMCFPSISQTIKHAVFIASAAPVGANLAIYAERHGGDSQSAAAVVCLSTVLSIVTMPLMLLVF